MGRYTGPIVKICRREGVNLVETPKAQKYMERRPYPPGEHGQRRRRRISDYGVRLREKQKLRFLYNLSEKQFANLFAEASKKKGATGTVFLQLLEQRLDNVVYRMGIAHTRRQARQFVAHRHIAVNGRRVDVPSYRVQPGDEISVVERSKKNPHVQQNVEDRQRGKTVPWLDFDPESLKGVFRHVPSREDIVVPVNELQVIEYYSR